MPSFTRSCITVVLFALTVPAQADILFFEPFNTDTATTAQTLATYSPPFTYTGTPTNLVVSNGVLNMDAQAFPNFPRLTVSGYTGNITVDVDLGKSPGGADFNTGLIIGDNRLLFHPGLFQGQFRVEGPGGFFNENMGFTPDPVVLHHMKVDIDAATGLFNITVTDANNPANVYQRSFTNPGYAPGGIIGMDTDGAAGTGTVLFDNFMISRPSVVPEPGGAALLIGIATVSGLAFGRRRSLL